MKVVSTCSCPRFWLHALNSSGVLQTCFSQPRQGRAGGITRHGRLRGFDQSADGRGKPFGPESLAFQRSTAKLAVIELGIVTIDGAGYVFRVAARHLRCRR